MANVTSEHEGKQTDLENTREEHREHESLIENQKNSKWVICKFCGSKILRPSAAEFIEKEIFLPSMHQKTKLSLENPEGDTLNKHWLVKDMLTFENVGFSKTVDSIKYLTCADCEVGPIGWHSIQDQKSSYVSLERVNYE